MSERGLKSMGDRNGQAHPLKLDGNDNLKTTVDDAQIAVPVDLQYHDLSNPLPVELSGGNNRFETIKETTLTDYSTSGRSLMIGDTVGIATQNITFLDVSKYKGIKIFIKNNTNQPFHIRRLFFSHYQTNVMETRTLGSGYGSVELDNDDRAWVTGDGVYNTEDFETELFKPFEGSNMLNDIPLPYFALQLRQVINQTFPTGSIDLVIVGELR